jgi:hypothetical protein
MILASTFSRPRCAMPKTISLIALLTGFFYGQVEQRNQALRAIK